MDLPDGYPKGGKYRWAVVDDCWELPNASLACGPLKKDFFKAKGKSKTGPWEAASRISRILNRALRHGNNINITHQRGGWVDCASALAAVRMNSASNSTLRSSWELPQSIGYLA